MKQITLEELLKLQVEILSKVDNFCRKNSIRYTVDGGTALGTIRHKGYIPWDDDIDIAMPRPDYNKFISTFNESFPNLKVYAPELDLNYYAPYANVCDTRTLLLEGANGHHGMEMGVKIDVFPIDGVALNLEEYHKINRRIGLLWAALRSKRASMKIIWKTNKTIFYKLLIYRIAFTFRSYSSIQEEIIKLVTKYEYEEAQYVENLTIPLPKDIRCSHKAFEEYDDVPFEDITVSIIKGYDEYLTKLYGNYMELPPIEERVAHHDFSAFWK